MRISSGSVKISARLCITVPLKMASGSFGERNTKTDDFLKSNFSPLEQRLEPAFMALTVTIQKSKHVARGDGCP